MKKTLIAFVGALLAVGLYAATPASAAKGSTKVALVKGTMSGTQTITAVCGWNYQSFGPQGPGWYSFTAFSSSATGVVVKATGLGNGTMDWNMSQFQGQSWTFSSNNGQVGGNGSFNLNQQFGPPSVQIGFSVNINQVTPTGKYAGVSSGNFGPLNQLAVSVPQCDPGTAPTDPGNPGDVVVNDTESTDSPFNFQFSGTLNY